MNESATNLTEPKVLLYTTCTCTGALD